MSRNVLSAMAYAALYASGLSGERGEHTIPSDKAEPRRPLQCQCPQCGALRSRYVGPACPECGTTLPAILV